ncbi:MAG: MFS transporter, partial [Jatrophihabitans sp.]
MVVLDATVVNVALHDIRGALHFSTAGLSWVINAYTLSFGGLLLLGARAGDLLGRRRAFLGGVSVFTLASLAGGLASGPAELLIARAVQGAGGAFAAPSALALLMTMFPEARERTRAIGLYTAVSVGGAAVGLIAGGMLAEWASWRWVFFVNVPVGLVLVALAGRVLLETPRRDGQFDVAGAAASTLGMAALVYGFVSAA